MKRTEGEKDRLPIFRVRLRELQGDRSNTEFAEFLGMSRQTIGFYLNGDRIPDALGLLQIAEKCRVCADWLIGLSDSKSLDAELRQVCDYTGMTDIAIMNLHLMKEHLSKSNVLEIDLSDHIDIVANLCSLVAEHGDVFRDLASKAGIAQLQAERDKGPIRSEKSLFMMLDGLYGIESGNRTPGVVSIPATEATEFYRQAAIDYVEDLSKEAIDNFLEDYPN